MTRRSGVLAHITSLPGPHGIGTLGKDARQFATTLAEAGQHFWQMLPVGPTGYRDSPYQSPSTFAGNPLLIDLDDLVEEGLLHRPEIDQLNSLPPDRVDFGGLIPAKTRLLILAARRFLRRGGDDGYDLFRKSPWLDSYATFAAIKQSYGGRSWVEWEHGLAMRDPAALSRAYARLEGRIEVERAIQYLFHRQWELLDRTCPGPRGFPDRRSPDLRRSRLGRRLVATRPLPPGSDGRPTVVAGVPPDYFAATGQRWGNPIYDWEGHRSDLYQWWGDRLRATFARFDMVRIDHFRGFVAYWEIPAAEPTAVNGQWVDGPGRDLFTALRSKLARCRSSPRTSASSPRRSPSCDAPSASPECGLPSSDSTRKSIPPFIIPPTIPRCRCLHRYPRQRHDRWDGSGETTSATTGVVSIATGVACSPWLEPRGNEVNWDLINLVLGSAAEIAVVPVQDLLGLGSEARMNTPGREEGNWIWRMTEPLLAIACRAPGRRRPVPLSIDDHRRNACWDPETYMAFADLRSRPGLELIARISSSRSRDHRRPRLRARTSDRGRWLGAGLVPGSSESTAPRRCSDGPRLSSRPASGLRSTGNTRTSPLGPRETGFDSLQQCRSALARRPRVPVPPAHDADRDRGSVRRADAGQLGRSHRTASSPLWSTILAGGNEPPRCSWRTRLPGPAEYRNWLLPLADEIDQWSTTYFHVLEGSDPVLEWVKGSILRPILAALEDDEVGNFPGGTCGGLSPPISRGGGWKDSLSFQSPVPGGPAGLNSRPTAFR